MNVSILTAVGGDGVGEEIRQNLKTNKVDFSLMKIYPKDRSSFSFIVNTGKFKEHVIFSYRGANFLMKIDSIRFEKI